MWISDWPCRPKAGDGCGFTHNGDLADKKYPLRGAMNMRRALLAKGIIPWFDGDDGDSFRAIIAAIL